MSESTPVEIDAPAPGNRRTLAAVVGGVVLLVAAVLVATLVLGGGGGSDSVPEDALGPPVEGSAPVPPEPDGTADAASADASYEVYTTRNPFTPLVSTGGGTTGSAASTESGGATESGTGTTESGTGTTESGTGATESGTGTTGSGTGTTGSGTGATTAEDRVQLLDVFTDTTGKVVASVQVDSTVHQVGAGESFADGYTVVSLSVEGGSGVFRDATHEFTLTKGEQLLK